MQLRLAEDLRLPVTIHDPAYLGLVVKRLASLWEAAPEMVADATTRNACRAFRLPVAGADG